jgi:hypothetical protein
MTQDLPRHSQNRLKRVRASARRFPTLNSKISFHRFMMADMGPHAPITDAVFAAYLRCEMKALLLLDGSAPTDPEIQSWQQDIANSYKANASERLCTNVLENETCRGMPSLRVLRERAYRLIINPEISSPSLRSKLTRWSEYLSVATRRTPHTVRFGSCRTRNWHPQISFSSHWMPLPCLD